jgi:Xaa-Pro aminopeptidase
MKYPILLFNNNQISNPDPNFFYYSKLDVDNCYLLLLNKKRFLISTPFHKNLFDNFKKNKKSNLIFLTFEPNEIKKFLSKYIKNKKVGLDFNSISASRLTRLKKVFKIKPIDISKLLAKKRAIKNTKEINNIKKAVKISKLILDEVEQMLLPGLSEIEIKKILFKKTIEYGCSLAFEPIIAADSSSKHPHYLSSNKKLKNFCLIDFGVKYNYYCSDLTRCFFLKENKFIIEKYEEAKEILKNILKLFKKSENKKISVFIKNVNSILKEYNWPAMPHAIGHGIGLEVHEEPGLYVKNNSYFHKNMVLALEPAFYTKTFGIRFEEDILVLNNNAKIL